ncbi:MAG: signal peptidase II [Mariprofundaceae bacterium]
MSRTRAQILLFALLLAADQLTKWWIEQPGFRPFTVFDGWFDIVRAHNTGVAFSMFADLPAEWRQGLLLGITGGIALAMLLWWWRERRRAGLTSWLLTLILAGAAGNMLDRARLGYVVDFIDWHVRIQGREWHWPAFNLADSCITLAVVLLLWESFRRR